jgi:hypothetical protein
MRRTSDRLFSGARSLKTADGIRFLCPKCFEANGGPKGTHSIICWQPHVPQTTPPTPGRWSFEGSTLDNLTLVAASSSIRLTGGCMAHFWIRDGEAVPCSPGWR